MKPVTENELVERSVGDRVTQMQVESSILSEHYFTAAEGELGRRFCANEDVFGVPNQLETLTFCVLTLWNGFTVVGQSACADPANFKRDIGERIAREDAVKKIWAFLGFELRSKIAAEAEMVKSAAFQPLDQEVYIGEKLIYAKPMTRGEYVKLRGWPIPADESGDDEGYLVEYADKINTSHGLASHLGYISWSPKDVFERAYRPVRSAAKDQANGGER